LTWPSLGAILALSPSPEEEARGPLERLCSGLGLPQSRPMPVVGARCHELRVRDLGADWRIVYRLDPDAVVILEVFSKKTRATPKSVIDACIRRVKEYDRA
jgi:phage-related protein